MLIWTTQSILQNWIRSTTAWVCTFDCKTNYTYNIGANTCDANTQQAIACNGSIKPYSTDNSTTTTWTQTWNETQWLPVYTYTQNTTPNICTFVCNTGYTWDSVNEVCAVNIYTVTFNSNGGTTVSSINANYNTTITAPTPPTKTGYTFAGWYKDAWLTTAWNFTTDTVTVATTLYAKWIITTFTLSSSSVTSGTPITISHNCITPPTSYTSSNTAVATISATTITSLAAGTTNITPIGGNCNDSVTKVLVVTAPQYPWCSIPDIPVGWKYWAACNVWASQPSTAYVASANDSTIWTETTNWKYFQWWENVAWDYDGWVTSTDNCTWNRDTQACGASALWAWSATVSDVTSGWVDRWNDWSTTDTRWPCAP
ncbi:MAG: Cell wall/surface repeat protein, partial [uncultured bacterium (gcode 4)]